MAEIKLPTGKGALASLGPTDYSQAMDLARLISRPAKPVDPALLSLLYFTGVSEAAGKGASLGESLAGGFRNPATYLAQQAQLERERERNLPLVGLQVASLMKPKQGKPSTIKTGIATGDDGKPLIGDDGKPLFEYTTYDASGKQISTFNAPDTSGTTVNLGGNKKYSEVFSKTIAEPLAEKINVGFKASEKLNSLKQMANLLENIDTGPISQFTLPFKRIASQLGFEIDESELASQDAFAAKANEIVLASVKQMTGAISEKELGFLQTLAPSLTNSKAGNRLLIMMLSHAAERQRAFSEFALEYVDPETGDTIYDSAKAGTRMQNAWREDPRFSSSIYEYVKNEAAKELQSIKTDPQIIKEFETLDDVGKNNRLNQIKNMINQKYMLSTLKQYYVQ